MKTHKFFSLLLAALLLLGGTACEDLVDDFEEDPNNAPDAPTATIINSVLVSGISATEGEYARLAAMWSRQYTGQDRQYSAYHNYVTGAGDFDWDTYYVYTTSQADIVIDRATEFDNRLTKGIMLTHKALMFGTATSVWGDIPFSEANRFPEIEDPAFDAQSEVYAGVQALLDEAIADFGSGLGGTVDEGGVSYNDFYFGGDAAAWSAAANTLKARYFMHTGNYASAISAAQSGISSPAGDMTNKHTGGNYGQDMNLYYSFIQVDRNDYFGANDSYMATLVDPASDTYRGNAKTDESARFTFLYTSSPDYFPNTSDDGMFAATAEFPVVTYVENQLILAEAYARTGNAAAAITALNGARSAHAAQFGTMYEDYVMADFQSGGIANGGQDMETALLMEILEEKYISMAGQIEAFNDVRRTDNALGIPPVTGSMIPQRFLIPQDEINANANAPSPIPDLFDPTPVNQ
ncbi:MAG: SusD/RagB family nutrient-binding outer membrane lipoprotein [Bacteroidota bacterium]